MAPVSTIVDNYNATSNRLNMKDNSNLNILILFQTSPTHFSRILHFKLYCSCVKLEYNLYIDDYFNILFFGYNMYKRGNLDLKNNTAFILITELEEEIYLIILFYFSCYRHFG